MSEHLGARVPDEISQAIESIANEFGISKSELIREVLRESILESDRVERLPEHLRAQLRREQRKQRNQLEWQRIHFPSNCKDRVVQAWKQGDLNPDLNPGALSDLMEIYREDARDLFRSEPERLDTILEYLDRLEESTREAEAASDLDPLDPSEIYRDFEGVDRSRIGDSERSESSSGSSSEAARLQNRAQLLERVRAQIQHQEESKLIAVDREAAVRAVARQHDLEEELLRDAASSEGILDD